MAYEVKITPGRNKEKKFELDESLKAGCDDAVKYGTRILVYGDPRCGKTSVLKYFISKASDYFGVDESDVLYMDDVEFIGMTDTCNEYRKKAISVGINNVSAIHTLQQELQQKCDITQLESLNILNGYHAADYVKHYERMKNHTTVEVADPENLEWLSKNETTEQMTIIGDFDIEGD